MNPYMERIQNLKAKISDNRQSKASNLVDELFNEKIEEKNASLKQKINDMPHQTNKLNQNKLTAPYVSSVDKSNILVDGIKVSPMRSISESPLNESIKNYLALKSIKQLTVMDWYCLPTIIRGRHLFAMPNKYSNLTSAEVSMSQMDGNEQFKEAPEKDQALTYLCPLVSLMLDQIQIDSENEKKKKLESGYIKQSLVRSQNGPILLIICSSCKNAQRIYEIISEMIDLSVRSQSRLQHANESYKPTKALKALLLQGNSNYFFEVFCHYQTFII